MRQWEGFLLLINLLLTKVSSVRGIALAVASYGIVATFLEGDRIVHSAFKFSLNLITWKLPCAIFQNNVVIVWDERSFEVLSRILKDVKGNDGVGLVSGDMYPEVKISHLIIRGSLL